MSVFHQLKVKSIVKETPETVAVSIEIPEHLKKDFQYKSGQYITFRIKVNGTEYNRSYSLCSAPKIDNDLTVAVKVVTGGKVSTFMNNGLKEGQKIEAMPPMGNFLLDPNVENENHYILFGGGSGITPLFSIIKTVLEKEPKSKVTLFYGNCNSKSVIFKKQLTNLETNSNGKFKMIHILSHPEKTGGFLGFGKKSVEELVFIEGRITEKNALNLLKEHTDLNFKNAEFYICGPEGMMNSASSALSTLAIPSSKVHREFFTEKSESEKEAATVGSGNVEDFKGISKITVIYDSNEHEFEMKEKETILDAALDSNVDPPFACMVGACTTCRAKLLEGKVHMNDSEALTEGEIKEGYILTCQSHPKTSVVKVNYDE